jgi:WXXGXW repeat (2 copies)
MKRKLVVRGLLFALVLMAMVATLPSASMAQIAVGISVRIGPPALPVYEQPLCPGPGYLWTPGYWAWDDDDGYYWVPGTWVVAPVGLLWTPGYWGWNNGFYAWNAGYWGPHVGFYGGINYGFGYGGVGFFGGEWRGGAFFYNTAVMHVDTVHITNVYVNRTVIVNNESHVAFNGPGGVTARPTAQELSYAHETHREALPAQVQQRTAASHNRALFASENHGRPAVAATARPGEFSGRNVVAARAAGGEYHAPAISPKEARGSAPAAAHGTAPANRGNASSNGFHSFTPPNKGNGATENRGVAERNTENRGGENRPAAKPFTPPASHAANQARPANEGRPATEGRPANKARPQNESRPAPHSEPAHASPRESAPKPAPHESAPAKHESAPKEEHHPGR